MRRTLPLCLLLASLGLGGCGGEDGPAETTAAETKRPPAAPAKQPGSGKGPGGKAAPARSTEGTPADPDVDLSTDPASIPEAIVTGSGAVQTLAPSEAARRSAQKNSYSSIKAFGEEAGGDEATEITFALVQYLTAKADGDWDTTCARIYGPLRANLERGGRSCPQSFGALMSRSAESTRAEQARIDVSSIRRGEGNRAFVIYKTPQTLSADMPMYVEEGIWKVGAIEAYVLTPEQVGE
jgi:hypothetical protein